jgi:hypothetical protein
MMAEFWWAMLWATLIIPMMFLWGFTLVDIFRRRDIGWSKVLWVMLVLFVPIIGVIVYFIARPKDYDSMAPAYAETDLYGARPVPYDQSYRDSQEAGSLRDVEALVQLRARGAISEEEFVQMKERIIAT